VLPSTVGEQFGKMDGCRVAKSVSLDDTSLTVESRGPAFDVSIRRHSKALLSRRFGSQLLRNLLHFHCLY